MKSLLLVILLTFGSIHLTFAAPQRLAENEVSVSNLKIILAERFGTSIEDDGTLIVKSGEYFQANIIINSKDKVLAFLHGWTAKPGADKLKCLELVNKWNEDRAFNCAYYDSENKAFIWSYHLAFAGGIDRANLLDTVTVLLTNEEIFVKTFYEAGVLE